ncbi:hypothetical protein DOY81_007366, partial [Sarcophaga bullata]
NHKWQLLVQANNPLYWYLREIKQQIH